MPKPTAGLFAVAALTVMLALSSQARAEVQYPWCALYSGEQGDGGTNCGFVTREQCMATISGIGGTCYENLAYVSSKPKKPAKRGTSTR